MPLDNRRFNGPEDSVSYKCFTKDYIKNYEQLWKGLLDHSGKRKDGRALLEFGLMHVNANIITQAKGSAYIEHKDTKVVCSVFDPREIPHQNEFSQLGQIFCEVKFASFSCPRQRRPLAPDAEEKALSVALRQALEPAICRNMFPNYQVDIFVYILQHGGACLAASINAAGLALANAAVPMYDIITAASMAICGDRFFVDPTEEEEYVALMSSEDANHGTVTLSVLAELKQVTDFAQVGSMDVECVNKTMDILYSECEKLVPKIKKCLVRYVVDSFQEKQILDKESKAREDLLDVKLEEFKKKLRMG